MAMPAAEVVVAEHATVAGDEREIGSLISGVEEHVDEASCIEIDAQLHRHARPPDSSDGEPGEGGGSGTTQRLLEILGPLKLLHEQAP